MQMQNIQYNRIMHTVFTRDSDSAQTKSVRLDMTTDGRRQGGEPSGARGRPRRRKAMLMRFDGLIDSLPVLHFARVALSPLVRSEELINCQGGKPYHSISSLLRLSASSLPIGN